MAGPVSVIKCNKLNSNSLRQHIRYLFEFIDFGKMIVVLRRDRLDLKERICQKKMRQITCMFPHRGGFVYSHANVVSVYLLFNSW